MDDRQAPRADGVTAEWAKKHMPHYIQAPFFLPERTCQAPMREKLTDIRVLPPENMTEGERYPTLLWCVDGELGSYESLLAKLPARQKGVVLYPVKRTETEEGPLAQEQAAYAALPQWLEQAQQPWMQTEKLLIGGWGFGAQTAAYAMSRTDRFAGAVLGPGVFDRFTAYGTGSLFPQCRLGEHYDSLLAFFEDGVKHSVLTEIDAIKVPILFLYDRGDDRIALGQVEEFFSAMKDRHPEIPCRMVVSPEHGPRMLELEEAFLGEITAWMEGTPNG